MALNVSEAGEALGSLLSLENVEDPSFQQLFEGGGGTSLLQKWTS